MSASEGFAEGIIFGLAFVGMAAYQLVLAGLLVARPSPRAHRAGIWGSALIVAVYLTTRVVPPADGDHPGGDHAARGRGHIARSCLRGGLANGARESGDPLVAT